MRRRTVGFTTIEMLGVLIMMGTFAAVGSSLVGTSFKYLGKLEAAQARVAGIDSMLRALRADVWDARDVSGGGDGGIVIRSGQGSEVEWTKEGEGTVRRTVKGGEERRWAGVGKGVAWAVEGPVVVLRFARDGGAERDDVRLVSQVMLAGRVR